MHRAAPPVDATAGVVFVTAGGLSLVALLVDVLAVTVRRPAVAGLPLLAVYCVPAAVLPDGLPWPLFLLAGAGLPGARRPSTPWTGCRPGDGCCAGTDSRGRSAASSSAGARQIAWVSLAFAVVLPLLVPGLGERVLGSTGRGRGPGRRHRHACSTRCCSLRQDLGDARATRRCSRTPRP